MDTGGLDLPNEVIVSCINNILTTSSEASGASSKKMVCKRKPGKPWSSSLMPLVKLVKEKTWAWKQTGKDQNSLFIDDIAIAKRNLHSAQRQMAAIQRKSLLTQISAARDNDKDLFYKLVRRQRSTSQHILSTIDFGDSGQTEGWASYYETLATPVDKPEFSESQKASLDLTYLLLRHQELQSAAQPEVVTIPQILKHVKGLKNRKAADLDGVTAEHLKLASDEIIPILTSITNKTLLQQRHPTQFKLGKITPVLKKGKPA